MRLHIKKSRAITSAEYDIKNHILTLEFVSSDKKYDYAPVPAKVVLGLKCADSIGKYYNINIRNKYGM